MADRPFGFGPPGGDRPGSGPGGGGTRPVTTPRAEAEGTISHRRDLSGRMEGLQRITPATLSRERHTLSTAQEQVRQGRTSPAVAITGAAHGLGHALTAHLAGSELVRPVDRKSVA